MPEDEVIRKLAAIMHADVKGYSRLMGENESYTVRCLVECRQLFAEKIDEHRGRVVNAPGDSILAEFPSVVSAVQCAVEIQKNLRQRNTSLPGNQKMEYRIGVNLGDVIESEGAIYGDGVNITARIEAFAEPGGVSIARNVYNQVRNKLKFGYEYQGEHQVKNISEPVHVYKVMTAPGHAGQLIGEPKTPKRLSKQSYISIFVVLALVASTAIWHFYPRAPEIEPASVEKMSYPLPVEPSVAVLPFDNMSGDPNQEYFADGVTENIIAALSNVPYMFVIARNSTFAYKGKAVKVQQVAEELGIRYVIEGSIQKTEDRVRITAQLIDAITGKHLWAERYDSNLKDLFTLQDEITQQIVSALGVKFEQIEQERALRKDTADLNAFDYNLRGWWYYKRKTKKDNDQARFMFEKAIEIDPKFADALAGLGLTYYEQWARQWSQDPQSLERAFELGKRAIVLDDSRSAAYSLLSHVYLWKKQPFQAIEAIKRTIELDPNDADGYMDLAETLVWVGKPLEALELVEKAMRLNPHYPAGYLIILGFAYLNLERYEEAVAVLKRALIRSPDHLYGHLLLATIYSEVGREKEARAYVVEALRVNPQLSIEDLRQRLPAMPERGINALRKAGLPE